MIGVPCCAHKTITEVITNNEDGTCSSSHLCQACGSQFVLYRPSDANKVLDELEKWLNSPRGEWDVLIFRQSVVEKLSALRAEGEKK